MRDSVFFIGQDQEFEDFIINSKGISEDGTENLTFSEQTTGITYYKPPRWRNERATKPP